MDRRTVFADGLIQPRAMKVLEQGVLVGEPPNVWLMRDIDGDLRSDRKELVTAGYGRRETNVEVNANALLWGLDNRIHMAGTGADMILRLVDRTFQVQKSLSRGQWGATQDDAGRVYRNHNESVLHVDLVPTPYYARNPALLRTRGSHEALQDPSGNINDVWPAHQTPGTNRAYQHGVLRADGTLAALHRRLRADRLPRRPAARGFVWQRLRRRADRQRGQPARCCLDDGRTLRARKAYRPDRVPDLDRRAVPAGVFVERPRRHALRGGHVPGRHSASHLHHRVPPGPDRQPRARAADRAGAHLSRRARAHHARSDHARRNAGVLAAGQPAVASERLVARHRPASAGGARAIDRSPRRWSRWRTRPRSGGPAGRRCGRWTA